MTACLPSCRSRDQGATGGLARCGPAGGSSHPLPMRTNDASFQSVLGAAPMVAKLSQKLE
jgi:hypothetical protein